MLRVNTGIKPNAAGACVFGVADGGSPSRLGALDGDLCGFPNGRRLARRRHRYRGPRAARGLRPDAQRGPRRPEPDARTTSSVTASTRTTCRSSRAFPYIGTPQQGYEHSHDHHGVGGPLTALPFRRERPGHRPGRSDLGPLTAAPRRPDDAQAWTHICQIQTCTLGDERCRPARPGQSAVLRAGRDPERHRRAARCHPAHRSRVCSSGPARRGSSRSGSWTGRRSTVRLRTRSAERYGLDAVHLAPTIAGPEDLTRRMVGRLGGRGPSRRDLRAGAIVGIGDGVVGVGHRGGASRSRRPRSP